MMYVLLFVICSQVYQTRKSLYRSLVTNISTFWSNISYFVIKMTSSMLVILHKASATCAFLLIVILLSFYYEPLVITSYYNYYCYG